MDNGRTNNQSKKDLSLLAKMVSLPRFLSYDLGGKGIEVKPNRFSPIYINLKSVWCYPEILFPLIKKLTHTLIGCSHVIGIETGGSPYAVMAARDLKIPLILARKESKKSVEHLAGYTKGDGTFAIVDDVLASGFSMEPALKAIQNDKRKVRLASILSYGMDALIEKKYNIKVYSLYQIEDVLKVISPELAEVLTPVISKFKKELKEKM